MSENWEEITPPAVVARDRYGRPMVIPAGGGKPVAYTRCTTYVDCLEDKYGLQKWMMRMTALGLSQRPDLALAVAAHKDDKAKLDSICEDAKEAAGGSAAAGTGTALHSLTELVDRGEELPVLPDSAKADLAAYRETMAPLKVVDMERFVVLDTHKVGGTFDRLVEFEGERYIADIKTGSIEYGALKISMQMAVYARSWLYDAATGERTAHGASTNRALIIHLPAGTGTCELVWVDIETGWEAVLLAKQVREKRSIKFKDLTVPFTGTPERPSLRLQKAAEVRAEDVAQLERERLVRMIENTPDIDTLRHLWSPDWDADLVAIATARAAELKAAS